MTATLLDCAPCSHREAQRCERPSPGPLRRTRRLMLKGDLCRRRRQLAHGLELCMTRTGFNVATFGARTMAIVVADPDLVRGVLPDAPQDASGQRLVRCFGIRQITLLKCPVDRPSRCEDD